MIIRTAFGLIGSGLLAFSLHTTPAWSQEETRWQAVDAHIGAMVERHSLEGLSLVIGQGETVFAERYLGDHQPETTHVMASSSKLVTSMILLSLVDDGQLDLDQPAGEALDWLPAHYQDVTLRQMLTHTSGMSGDHGLEHHAGLSLAQSAEALSAWAPTHQPGEAVQYGGGGLITAAAWAEQASGETWRSLFDSRIAGPLGFQDSYYGNPTDREAGADVRNPTVTGGLVASARDYQSLMAALTSAETDLLTASSMTLLFHHQTADADRSDMPGPIPEDGGTTLGLWCEDMDADGRCGSLHSLGAYGTLPWFDQRAGVYGLLMINGNLRDVLPDLRELQDLVRQAMAG